MWGCCSGRVVDAVVNKYGRRVNEYGRRVNKYRRARGTVHRLARSLLGLQLTHLCMYHPLGCPPSTSPTRCGSLPTHLSLTKTQLLHSLVRRSLSALRSEAKSVVKNKTLRSADKGNRCRRAANPRCEVRRRKGLYNL